MNLNDLREASRVLGDRQERIVAHAIAMLTAIFRAFNPWDTASVVRAAIEAADVAERSREAMSSTVDVYLQHLVSEAPHLQSDPAYPRQGTNPIEVWERPASQARYAETQEEDWVEAAFKRAYALVEQDVSLAARDSFNENLQKVPGVTGYRRILHPELSRYGSCGLCIVSANRIYTKAQLLPLHNGCRCTIAPIIGGDDPGVQLNNEDLGAFYEAAGGTNRQGLQRTRAMVYPNGEIGPVLVRRGRNGFSTQREPGARPERFVQQEIEQLRRLLSEDLAHQDWITDRLQQLQST